MTLRRSDGTFDLEPLARAAASIPVYGIPRDLLTLVRELSDPTRTEVLKRFYLPNALTYALVEEGLRQGALTEKDGRLTAAPRPAALRFSRDAKIENDYFAALEHLQKPQFYQQSDRYFGPELERLINTYGDLSPHTSVLLVGDGEATGLSMRCSGVQKVWALDIDPDIAGYYRDRGITALVGDTRFMRGFVWGAFDLVLSYQIEFFQDDCIFELVEANLAPYGVYYTYFVASENERSDWQQFLGRYTGSLVLTDICQHRGAFLLRAVKYPELGG